MKTDRFDLIMLSAAAILAAAAFALVMTGGEQVPRAAAASRLKAEPPDPKVYQEIDTARNLMEAGQAEEAVKALVRISGANPAMSEPHALMGQSYARLLDYPAAMREYRMALVMDPDYADKKSKKFIGKRIKAAVKDGMAEAKEKLARDPDDHAARVALKDAYYLERMLAGGCE